MLKTLLVSPNQIPEELTIKNFDDIRNYLGDWTKVTELPEGNATAIIPMGTKNLKANLNRFLYPDFIYGDFIIVGRDKNGKPKNLSKKQSDYYKQYFGEESINYVISRLQMRKAVRKVFLRR